MAFQLFQMTLCLDLKYSDKKIIHFFKNRNKNMLKFGRILFFGLTNQKFSIKFACN